MPQPASAAITCSTVPIRAVAIGQNSGQTGVDHAIETRRNVHAEVGATEYDAMVGRRRSEGQADAATRVQSDADAADRRLQRSLAPGRSFRYQGCWQTVHGPRLIVRTTRDGSEFRVAAKLRDERRDLASQSLFLSVSV